MTLKSLNKKFAIASVALLTASAFATAGLASFRVNAKTIATNDQVSNGEVAIYAEQAAPTAGANYTGTVNDGSDQSSLNTSSTTGDNDGKAGTDNGDGTKTNVGTAAAPGTATEDAVGTVFGMSNVKFSAYPLTLTANSWADAVAPTGVDSNTGKPTGQSGFTIGSTATKTATSDSTGLADITGLTNGYYLIQQMTNVGGVYTITPFIVQVNSNDSGAGILNVYPKMSLSSANDAFDVVTTTDTEENTDGKTANEVGAPNATNTTTDTSSKDASNTMTASNGATVTWNVNTTWDGSQVTSNNVAGSYTVTDKLPDGVTTPADGSGVTITLSNGTTLTSGDDFTATVTGQTVTITFNSTQQLTVAGDFGIGNTGQLNIQIASTVNSGVVIDQGKDTPSTTVTNGFGVDLSNKEITPSVLNVGGLDFTKVDATDKTTKLSGAEFVLVQAANLADAQALVTANASYFNNSVQTDNPTTMTLGSANFVTNGVVGATGTTIQTTTTGEDGIGTFTGLNLVDENTDTSNTTNYFAVEVKAPKGYALPTPTANVFGAENANTKPAGSDNTITNNKPFALPFTGGEGLVGIIIIATVAGVAALVIKRRKDNEEEVVK